MDPRRSITAFLYLLGGVVLGASALITFFGLPNRELPASMWAISGAVLVAAAAVRQAIDDGRRPRDD